MKSPLAPFSDTPDVGFIVANTVRPNAVTVVLDCGELNDSLYDRSCGHMTKRSFVGYQEHSRVWG